MSIGHFNSTNDALRNSGGAQPVAGSRRDIFSTTPAPLSAFTFSPSVGIDYAGRNGRKNVRRSSTSSSGSSMAGKCPPVS